MAKQSKVIENQGEVVGNTLSVVDNQTGEIMNAADVRSLFKTKKRVTVPLLKQRVGLPIAVVFLTPMRESKPIAKSQIKEPATISTVFNLADGHVYDIIINTVTRSEINTAYPDNGYVGKGFLIEMHTAGEGKRYHLVDIQEIEIPEGTQLPAV